MFLNCGVGEDSLESLGCKEIKPVNLKGDQSWTFIGRTCPFIDGHKFEQAPVAGDVQGSLAWFSLRGCKELDKTEWLNWTEPQKKKCWCDGSKSLKLKLWWSSCQMLISSRNTLPDTSQKCCTAIWVSLSPVKLTHKLACNCAPIPLEVNPTSPS